MKLKLTILTLIYCLNSTAQTALTQITQNFCANETANGYTLRGQDIQALHHNTMDATISCLDNGQQTVTLTNIVAWYPNIGTSLTSQSLNLVSSNTITFTGSPTANDGYITYNGSSQYGTLGNLGITTQARTVSLWFKGGYSSTQYCLFGWGVNSYTQEFGIFINSTANGSVYIYGVNDDVYTGGVIPNDGLWHNLIIVYDGGNVGISTLHIYLDSSPQSTSFAGSTAPYNTSNSNYLIANNSAAGGLYPGSIQDLLVANTNYSATTIGYIYNWQLNNLGYANKH